MFTDYLTFTFSDVRMSKLIKNDVNIINSTNPFQITRNITQIILN